MLAGPAILWGILFSDCKRHPLRREQNQAADDSFDAADTQLSIQEESDNGQSGESVRKSLAGPANLWGILASEVDLAACKVLDAKTVVNLWLAAGYECQLPLFEENAPTPPAVEATSTTDEDPPRPPDPIGPYIIKASPGKGQGIFASRAIPAGSRILADKPFLLVPKPYNNLKVLSAFERMPLSYRKLYMQLSCPDHSSFSANDIHTTDVMRIFEANCFNLGDQAAVFLTATRFNHSCLPNTYYSWSDTRHEIAFHSMLDIPQGEELTICYGRPARTRLERRSELRIYNFCCRCPACDVSTVFGQASESRRREMRALDEQIVMFQSLNDEARMTHGLQDPLTAILRLIELIKEEGLHGELMTPYRDAADLLQAKEELHEASVFARLELEEEVRCLGVDSEVVGKTREYIRGLEMALAEKVEEAKRRELGLDNETMDPSADT